MTRRRAPPRAHARGRRAAEDTRDAVIPRERRLVERDTSRRVAQIKRAHATSSIAIGAAIDVEIRRAIFPVKLDRSHIPSRFRNPYGRPSHPRSAAVVVPPSSPPPPPPPCVRPWRQPGGDGGRNGVALLVTHDGMKSRFLLARLIAATQAFVINARRVSTLLLSSSSSTLSSSS